MRAPLRKTADDSDSDASEATARESVADGELVILCFQEINKPKHLVDIKCAANRRTIAECSAAERVGLVCNLHAKSGSVLLYTQRIA